MLQTNLVDLGSTPLDDADYPEIDPDSNSKYNHRLSIYRID